MPTRFHVTLSEVRPDGTTKERFDGTCDAYVLAVAQEHNDELRIFTDHDVRRANGARPSRA